MFLFALMIFKFLKLFSRYDVSSVKDPATRFNIALNMPSPFKNAYPFHLLGFFSERFAHFLPPPDNQDILYEILFPNKTTGKYSFRWLAKTSINFTDSKEFMRYYYSSHPKNPQEQEQEQPKKVENKDLFAEFKILSSDPIVYSDEFDKKFNLKQDPNIKLIKNDTKTGVGMYQYLNDTLVWYMNSFEPGETAESYYDFESTINSGFFYANFYGLDKLIIDLTLNGGGDICLGRSMLTFLFPNLKDYGPTDMPSSQLARNLTRTAVKQNIPYTEWSPSFYATNDNDITYKNNDPSWLIPGVSRVRGGKTRSYSQLIHISSNVDGCGKYPFVNMSPFKPKKNYDCNQRILRKHMCIVCKSCKTI